MENGVTSKKSFQVAILANVVTSALFVAYILSFFGVVDLEIDVAGAVVLVPVGILTYDYTRKLWNENKGDTRVKFLLTISTLWLLPAFLIVGIFGMFLIAALLV